MRYAKFQFSHVEKADLLKAWIATSIAFGIFFSAGEKGIMSNTFSTFLGAIMFAGITAGVGFLGHELCHKWAASRFGVHSEFRSNDQMLLISIIVAFFGVIFAAPGAVQIYQPITKKENGVISAAGPLANIIMTLLFLPLALLTVKDSVASTIGYYGVWINAMLGVFNLIPLWDFDGFKVLAWNKMVYFSMVIVAAVLVVTAFMI